MSNSSGNNPIFALLHVFEDDQHNIYFMPSDDVFYGHWKQERGEIVKLSNAVVKVTVNCFEYTASDAHELVQLYLRGLQSGCLRKHRLD